MIFFSTTRFLIFKFSFFQADMESNCEGYINFWDTEHHFQENGLHLFFHYNIL